METFTTVLGILTIFAVLAIRYSHRTKGRSPPGPVSHPIIGHALVFPRELAWEIFHSWSKDFDTDIIQLSILGTNIVVLDTLEAAKTLLDNRSSIYSSRPRMPMVTELMGWDFNLGTMPYGPRWRAHRKLLEKSFNFDSGVLYEARALESALQLTEDLHREPDKFLDHFRHLGGSVILSTTYGIEIQKVDDPYVILSEAGISPVLEAVIPGTYLVDTFPILKYVPDWMPGANFKKIAKEARVATRAMIELPFAHTKNLMANENIPPSFVSMNLQKVEECADPNQDELIKNTAAAMYSAGFDNIIATLTGFILCMIDNPDAQKKAQHEIDSIILKGELPTFSDKDSLPYVTALTYEVFRCSVSSPIGAPHMLEADDEYNGYTLKNGSIVFANIWAILHDENTYPEPFKFNPERFLRDGKIDVSASLDIAAFGFGRRICPGRYMGFSTIWIAIASILATCDISKAFDDQGNIIEPVVKYSTASSCMPNAFKCSINPRTRGCD